jgi:hypothetical protein
MAKQHSDRRSLQELFHLVEASGLHDHPNPERIGCLSDEAVEAFARNPGAHSIDGPEYQHLANCSPCFRFVDVRRARQTHGLHLVRGLDRRRRPRGSAGSPHAARKPNLQDLFRLVEQSGQHDYPNPERKGCPSEEVLDGFARDPSSFSIFGEEFQHVTHCSPCFGFVETRRKTHHQPVAKEAPRNLSLDDVLRLMERSALRDYANPNRIGCPPEETLEAVADNPRSFDMDAPVFEHLTHCSPCFSFVQGRRTEK